MSFNRFWERHNTGQTGRTPVSGPTLRVDNGEQYQLEKPQSDPYETDPAAWDYKTAKVGMNGEPLPDGAVGWKPNGEAYFGEGIKGWWNGVTSRVKNAWEEGRDRGAAFDAEKGTELGTYSVASVEAAKQVGSEVLFGALGAVGSFAQVTEQVAGTVGYVLDDALNGRPQEDLKTNWEASRLAYNEVAHRWLPVLENKAWIYENQGVGKYIDLFGYLSAKIVQNDAFVEMARRGDGIRQEFAYRMANGEDPALIAEDLQIRGAANTWVEMGGQLIFDPLNAVDMVAKTPRAVQTAETVRATFAVAESANVADFLSDARQVAKAGDEVTAMKNFDEALDAARTARTEAGAMVDVLRKPGTIDAAGLPARAKSFAKYIPESRNVIFQNRAGEVMRSIATTQDPNDAIDVLNAMVDLASKDDDKAKAAFMLLAKQPNASVLMSQAGNETGAILTTMMEKYGATWINDIQAAAKEGNAAVGAMLLSKMDDTLDDLYPSAMKIIQASEDAKTTAKGVEAADSVMDAERQVETAREALKAAKGADAKKAEKSLKAAEKMLSDAKRMQYNADKWAKLAERMTPAEKLVAKAHYGLQKGLVGKLNHFFSDTYMGKSFAFANRNKFNNDLMVFLDYGPSTAFANGDNAMLAANKWAGGVLQKVEGYGAKVQDATDIVQAADNAGKTDAWTALKAAFTDPKTGKFTPNFDTRRMSEVFEQNAAKKIVGTTYTKTFQQAIEPMFNALKKDKAYKNLSADAWSLLEGEFYKNYGDVDAALDAVKRTMATGIVDEFADARNVPAGLRKQLEQYGAPDAFQKTVLQANSKDEAMAALNKIFDDVEQSKAAAYLEPYALQPGDKLDDAMAVVMNMGYEASDTSRVIKARKIVFREAWKMAEDAVNSLDDTARAIVGDQKLNALKKQHLVGWGAAASRNDRALDLTNAAVSLAEKDPTKMADLWALLKKSTNIPGEMPTDLKSFKNAVWSNYKIGIRPENWALDIDNGINKAQDYIRALEDAGVPVDTKIVDKIDNAMAHAKSAENWTVGDYGIIVNDPVPNLSGSKTSISATLAVKRYGIPLGSPQANEAVILNIVRKETGVSAKSLDDISLETIDRALAKHVKKVPMSVDEMARAFGKAPEPSTVGEAVNAAYGFADDAPRGFDYSPKSKPVVPPYQAGTQPTAARVLAESDTNAVKQALTKYVDDNFGMTRAVTEQADSDMLEALRFDMQSKVSEIRTVSAQVAQENRNFTLLNYGMKTYSDVAAAYLMPYGFWYKGTYSTWARRLWQQPNILAGYAKYKNAMAIQNAGLPDWWKQNIKIDSVLGIDLENPLYFNLEATLWPLNGITGEDFNDPEKQVNWWSYTIDQMGKFGPSVWTPINMATGLALRAQGETEASDRWLGRLVPQTSLIKTWTGVELDPMVGLVMGGYDPYEVKRIDRALADIVANDPSLKEQAIDEARRHEGPLWDAAVRNSNSQRKFGQTMSTLFGVGFKGRTQSDMQIDQFDAEYRRLMAMNKGGYVSSDTFREQMAQLSQKYPFMDTLLISRKSGPDRDAALGYNVLSRIPPGETSELFKMVGVDAEMVNRFYSDKGDMSKWTEDDRMRMTAGFLSMAATFKMPDLPTKQEWNDARALYKDMKDAVAEKYGNDVWDKVNLYYDAQSKIEKDALTERFPEIQKALALQNAYIVNDEILNKYYGGAEAIQNYYSSQVRYQLEQKYGKEIYDVSRQYMQILDTAGRKEFMKAHPNLKSFYSDKKALEASALKQAATVAAKMPTRSDVPLRDPQSETQQALGQTMNQQAITADQWQQELGAELFSFVTDYSNGSDMPYQVTQRLDYLSQYYGYGSGDDMLMAILMSLQQR